MIKNVMIDAVKYNIEVTDGIIVSDGEECGADVNFSASLIRLSSKIGEGAKPAFLMHEIFHALLHERGMYEEIKNEQLMDELASGVINLIRYNPDLVDYLTNSK